MPASPPALDDLLTLARAAREHAYAPYSGFHVGAAVLARDGRTFGGCNVENASYGLCNCAERTALFSAVAAGCRPGDVVAIAVVADTPEEVAPCGACHGSLDNKAGSPWLEGQSAAYIKSQLQAFASGERHNDINEQMRNIARAMTPQEIEEAANYYASQPPEFIRRAD